MNTGTLLIIGFVCAFSILARIIVSQLMRNHAEHDRRMVWEKDFYQDPTH